MQGAGAGATHVELGGVEDVAPIGAPAGSHQPRGALVDPAVPLGLLQRPHLGSRERHTGPGEPGQQHGLKRQSQTGQCYPSLTTLGSARPHPKSPRFSGVHFAVVLKVSSFASLSLT